MRRLSQLFRNIRQIRLMGGEPLLHPDPAAFIRITRAFFPETDLRFVTNGLLLPRATPAFWAACRETSAVIDITVYPPMKDRVAELRALCEKHRVTLEIREVETFLAHRDLSGSSDRQKAFDRCRTRYFCPYLENGRMYICAMSTLVRHFNKQFGFQVPSSRGLSIHAPFLLGRDVKKYLSRPVETCEWCAYEPVSFDWKIGRQVPQEWFPEMDIRS